MSLEELVSSSTTWIVWWVNSPFSCSCSGGAHSREMDRERTCLTVTFTGATDGAIRKDSFDRKLFMQPM